MSQELNISPNPAPPWIAQRCLIWALPKKLQEIVLGDLEEEFQQKYLEEGNSTAQFWYIRQAFLTSLTYMQQTQRGMLMFAISMILFVGMVGMAFLLSGELSMFFNIPSLLVVLPPAVFFAFAATSKQAIQDGMKLMLDDQFVPNKTQLLSSKRAFITLGNTAMLTGWLGFFIGLIAISSNMEPEVFKDAIGPAMAVCLLTVLYAYILKIPCYLIEQKIQHQLELFENEN